MELIEAQLEVAKLKVKLLELKAKCTKDSLQAVACRHAPAAIGPYSQAVKANDFLFVSGCLGLDPSTMRLVPGGISGETKQALLNLKNIVEFSGGSLSSVVRTTIFLTEMDDFTVVNDIYKDFFTGDRIGAVLPARVTVAVKALPKGGKVEIDATALLK